jgi:hypothetical protein
LDPVSDPGPQHWIQAAVSVLSGGRLGNLDQQVEQLTDQAGSAPPRDVTAATLKRLTQAAPQPAEFIR